MKQLINKTLNKITSAKTALMLFMANLVLFTSNVHAALPSTADPSNAAADGDYIGLLKGYFYDAFIVVGLVLGTVAFIMVVKNAITVYGEVGDGRKTWGALGGHTVAGVVLIVFVIYLLTEAAAVIF